MSPAAHNTLVYICMVAYSSLSYQSHAQEYVDIARVNYNWTSKNAFKESTASSRIREFDLETTIPVILSSSVTFIGGATYEWFRTRLYADRNEQTLSSVGIKAGVNIKHSAKWSGNYVLLPRIASDFEHITRKDFQVAALALLRYQRNNNVNYKMGLYVSNELFGPWIVPLLGMYYRGSRPGWEVNLVLPVTADINYSFTARVKGGVAYSGFVRTYHLSSSTPNDSGDYLSRVMLDLSGYVAFQLTDNLILQTKGGRSVGRQYRVYDDNDKISFGLPLFLSGDHRTQLNTDFDDGWVFQVMMIYRIHLTK